MNNQQNNKNDKNDKDNKKKNAKILAIFLIVSILGTFFFNSILTKWRNGTEKTISYNKFVTMLDKDQVKSVKVTDSQLKVTPKNEGNPFYKTTYTVQRISGDYELVNRLIKSKIAFEQEPEDPMDTFLSILISLIPTIVIFGFLVMMMRRSSGMMGVGKSNAKVYVEKKTGVTFADVAGQGEAKETLTEMVDFLHHPERYTEIGAKLPKGALLVGPPGTGKTLLAKAVAGEAGVPFFSLSGSDFVEMFVGVGASRVRDLFKQAQQMAPCIIFIDEFDVMGKENKNNERIIAQLAYEMNKRDHVLVIATTRNIKEISSSLKRPKHFEMFVSMFLPDFDNRMQIIEYCCNKKRVDPSVSVKKLAKKLIGASTLEIIKIMNMAIEIAEQKHHKNVLSKDFCEAQINCDEAVPLRINRTFIEKKATAYHEAGHAICVFLSQIKRIRDISIIPTQEFFGRVATYPLNEYGKMTKQDFEIEIMISLAGRVAEDVFFNSPTSGAKGDLEKTTKLVKQYLTEFCFDEEIGIAPVSCLSLEQLAGSDLNNRLLNRSVDLMNLFYKRTKEYLLQNKTMLEEIAQNYIEYIKNINLKNFILLLYGIALTIYLRIKIMSKSEISRVNSLIYDLFCCCKCLL